MQPWVITTHALPPRPCGNSFPSKRIIRFASGALSCRLQTSCLELPDEDQPNSVCRHIPLLVRRGGCGIKKILAQPTLAPQTGWSLTSQVPRERPPRPLQQGGFAAFSLCRVHHSSRGGDYARPKNLLAKTSNDTFVRQRHRDSFLSNVCFSSTHLEWSTLDNSENDR